MSTKICFINNKGGSAKTTTLVNIAGAISQKYPKARLLVIEGDGQGNATTGLGLNPQDYSNTAYDLFMGNKSASELVVNAYKGIGIIPANSDMNYLEFDMMAKHDMEVRHFLYDFITQHQGRYVSFEDFDSALPKSLGMTDSYFNMLAGKLDEIESEYDLILFDTPPELKAVTSSVLAVCNVAIIPFEPDIYAVDGIVNIISRVKAIQEQYNSNLFIGGLLATKVQERTKIHRDVRSMIIDYCNDNDYHYFKSEIPHSIRFADSAAYKGLPITITNPDNKFAQAYYDLLDEMESLGLLERK